MGAAHSNEPRSVSMDNPMPAGVIDVSDDVVERLKRGITKQKGKENVSSASATATPPPPPPSPKKEVRAAPAKPSPVPPPATIFQNPTPLHAPVNIGALSAMEVRRQKEIELQQNDTAWRQRLSQLEQTLKKTDVILEKEFATAAEDVRSRFSTSSASHQLPPCQDSKAQLLACYRSHPGETLKCADEVALFKNCVNINYLKRANAKEQKLESDSAVTAKAG